MNWYFIKVAYMSNKTRKAAMGGIIINCYPSSIWNEIKDRIDGNNIEIVNIVKL